MKRATPISRHGFRCNFAMEAWSRVGMAVALLCLLFSSIASAVHLSGACGSHDAMQECALLQHSHTHEAPGHDSPHYARIQNESHALPCLLCFWKSMTVSVTVEAVALEFPGFCRNFTEPRVGKLFSYRFVTCHNRGPPNM